MFLASRVASRWLREARQRRLTLYHGTKADKAAAILQRGFDLTLIKPRWTNDYAVSTLTTPRSIQKYFGDRPDTAIIEMTFNGNIITPEEASLITGFSNTPQSYARALLKEGVDAVMLNGAGAKQVYVYNVKALSNIHMWAAESAA